MPDIHIIIHGGYNQILPNATEAVQNFYISGSAADTFTPEGAMPTSFPDTNEPLPPEAHKLLPYVKDERTLRMYLRQIGTCRSAYELAQIILTLKEQEGKVPAEEEQKERFIRLFLPFVPKGVGGMTAHNIYTHIVNLKAARPHGAGK